MLWLCCTYITLNLTTYLLYGSKCGLYMNNCQCLVSYKYMYLHYYCGIKYANYAHNYKWYQYNGIVWELSYTSHIVTCSRLVVFSGIFGFFHQYNWYNWNIVERGVNHHGYNNISLVFMFMSNTNNDYVNRSRNICVTNDHDYVPHVEQVLLTLQHMSSLPVLTGVRVFRCLVFCVVFCRSLVVLLSFCPCWCCY